MRPVPEPREGEVLIKVAGAGACHSDLHVYATAAGNGFFKPPFTLGHENTGTVVALGPGARGVEIGERVAVYCAWGCGTCRMCVAGEENYCMHQRTLRGCGLGVDGGMAEYLLVPASKYLVPLGDLDPIDAAPLTDAGITPYHAINRSRALLRPGATCAVIGIGGLGHLALQILRTTTAVRIIALDVSDETRNCDRSAPTQPCAPMPTRSRTRSKLRTASQSTSSSTSSAYSPRSISGESSCAPAATTRSSAWAAAR